MMKNTVFRNPGPGEYFIAGQDPVRCPAGNYCPGYQSTWPADRATWGSLSRVPCSVPAGSYCAPGSAQNAGTACPGGSYCLGGSADATPCPEGSFCPAGAGSYTTCPSAAYCPAGAAGPSPCPPGTYNPNVGNSRPSDCSPCATAP